MESPNFNTGIFNGYEKFRACRVILVAVRVSYNTLASNTACMLAKKLPEP